MTIVHQKFCEAVARHFSITRAKIRKIGEEYFKDVGGVGPMLVLDMSEHLGVTLKTVCTKNHIHMSKMFFHKQIEKTELYTDLLNTFTNTTAETLTFLSGGALIVAYEARQYNGIGGIFARPEKGPGFAFEPIAHYLEVNYPKCNYRDETVL